MPSDYISNLLKQYYDKPRVAWSDQKPLLRASEERIVSHLRAELAGKDLLDLAVGAGRTTPAMRALGGTYAAIDYSFAMLSTCRARHAGARLALCDVRELCFPAASFDGIFFWGNAIGDLYHQDRMRVLREAHRLLRPEGIFVLSTHNLDAPWKPVYRFPEIDSRPGRALGRYARGILNHLKHRAHLESGDGYRVATDPGYDYDLLTYFVGKEAQLRQLTEAGFAGFEIVGESGTFVAPGEPCEDLFLYYIARKGGLQA